MTPRRFGLALSLLALVFALLPPQQIEAVAPGNEYFNRTWARTDQAVATGLASRTWMWGPEAFTEPLQESYAGSPGGSRSVQYFDKARMEITSPGGDTNSIWYVTNGLLVQEMVTGERQMGDNAFDQVGAAQINVAGDADDEGGPTYASMAEVLSVPLGLPDAVITSRINRSGTVINDPNTANYGVTAQEYVLETNHRVASVFWEFMNSQGTVYENGSIVNAPLFENPYYATGYPITEAYWANVKVGGDYRDVLLQCFQRRCLTYTPDNPAGWKVEAGNVGQHYFSWRYPQLPGDAGGDPIPPGDEGQDPFPPESPTEPLPDMIFTDYYLYPETAVYRYLEERGYDPSPMGLHAKHFYQIAPTLSGAYSMLTAEVGRFNHDTRGFYEWMSAFLDSGLTEDRTQHLCDQVYAGLYQPDTNIAQRLRQFEYGADQEDLGAGVWMYGYFLVGPAIDHGGLSPGAYQAALITFADIAEDYMNFLYSNPDARGFANYAASIGYMPRPCS